MGPNLLHRTGSPHDLLISTVCVNSMASRFLTAITTTGIDSELIHEMTHSVVQLQAAAKVALRSISLLTSPSLALLQALISGVSICNPGKNVLDLMKIRYSSIRDPATPLYAGNLPKLRAGYVWVWVLTLSSRWEALWVKNSITVSLGAIFWIRILLSRWEDPSLYLILNLDISFPTYPAISIPPPISFKFTWVLLEYSLPSYHTSGDGRRFWQLVYHLPMELGNLGWWICNKFERGSSMWEAYLETFILAPLTCYLDFESISDLERTRCSIWNISSPIRLSLGYDHHLPYHWRWKRPVYWYRETVFVRSPPGYIFPSFDVYICRTAKHGGLVALVSDLLHMEIRMSSDEVSRTLLVYPITAYFVLFCNVIATLDTDDFKLMTTITDCLTRIETTSRPIIQVRTIFQHFLSLAGEVFNDESNATVSSQDHQLQSQSTTLQPWMPDDLLLPSTADAVSPFSPSLLAGMEDFSDIPFFPENEMYIPFSDHFPDFGNDPSIWFASTVSTISGICSWICIMYS